MPVTDAVLGEVKKMPNLRSLHLDDTQVTDVGMKELKGLKNLTHVALGKTLVTDAGAKELSQALPNAKYYSSVPAL